MKKIFKRKSVVAQEEITPDIIGMISEIQRQLASLEQKVDSLISRPSERPSGGRPFSRPGRSFERSGFGRGRQEEGPRERSFTKVICAECGTECEVPFKPSADRPVYCRDCFAKRKDSGQDFRPRKKSSFRRRK